MEKRLVYACPCTNVLRPEDNYCPECGSKRDEIITMPPKRGRPRKSPAAVEAVVKKEPKLEVNDAVKKEEDTEHEEPKNKAQKKRGRPLIMEKDEDVRPGYVRGKRTLDDYGFCIACLRQTNSVPHDYTCVRSQAYGRVVMGSTEPTSSASASS